MNITVLFFGITTDLVGENSISIKVSEKTSVGKLKSDLLLRFNGLKNINDFAVAVNEEYAEDNLLIKEGDVIAIIPPVSGG